MNPILRLGHRVIHSRLQHQRLTEGRCCENACFLLPLRQQQSLWFRKPMYVRKNGHKAGPAVFERPIYNSTFYTCYILANEFSFSFSAHFFSMSMFMSGRSTVVFDFWISFVTNGHGTFQSIYSYKWILYNFICLHCRRIDVMQHTIVVDGLLQIFYIYLCLCCFFFVLCSIANGHFIVAFIQWWCWWWCSEAKKNFKCRIPLNSLTFFFLSRRVYDFNCRFLPIFMIKTEIILNMWILWSISYRLTLHLVDIVDWNHSNPYSRHTTKYSSLNWCVRMVWMNVGR